MSEEAEDCKPDMTPMIDVVFQLLVFFLVSMKFKTLDMKINAFLPKDKGLAATITKIEEKPKAVAVLKRKKTDTFTRIKFQNQEIGSTKSEDEATAAWARLGQKAKAIRDNFQAGGGDPAEVSGEVDAAEHVPTGDVIRAVDAFIAVGITNVTFVGAPPPGSALDQLRNQ